MTTGEHLEAEVSDSTGPWLLVGLDGEMSSADIETGGRLIQAGAAMWAGEPGGPIETFTTLIRHDEMEWSERAAQVHGITRDELALAPTAAEADAAMSAWLLDHGATAGRRLLVPIGLNVAAFDMPFFRQALPTTASLFARRAVDLNALCFSYAGWDPNPRAQEARDFAGWKRSMKTAANTALAAAGMPVREHDAGYDAAQALIGWWWLREQFTTVTDQLRRTQADLDAVDPLRAVLGAGLLGRLNAVPRPVIEQIVAELPPGKPARKWFGTMHSQLGCSPLAAIEAGRVDEVVALASADA